MRVCIYALRASTMCSLEAHFCHDINLLSNLLSMCRTRNLRDASIDPHKRSNFSPEQGEPPSRHECQRIVWAAVFSTLVPPHTQRRKNQAGRKEPVNFNTTIMHAANHVTISTEQSREYPQHNHHYLSYSSTKRS